MGGGGRWRGSRRSPSIHPCFPPPRLRPRSPSDAGPTDERLPCRGTVCISGMVVAAVVVMGGVCVCPTTFPTATHHGGGGWGGGVSPRLRGGGMLSPPRRPLPPAFPDLRIPLMWKDTEYFRNKGGE